MASATKNPLSKHFRQPAIYVRLPSDGNFWPNGSIELPDNKEVPIYPMTVKDEITLKTPDALMNGSGVVDVIQSCCPCIKNAWDLPVIDLDTLLISIRIASYGPTMDVDTECPHCKAENSHQLDLRTIFDEINSPNYVPIEINNLTFNFKPQTFKNVNSNNLISYEQQRLITAISNSEATDEQKLEQFNSIFPRLTEMNVMSLVNSIDSIETDNETVSDRNYIKEFIMNCDRITYQSIKDTIEKFNTQNKLQPVSAQCVECNETYKTELTFEQSNFFG